MKRAYVFIVLSILSVTSTLFALPKAIGLQPDGKLIVCYSYGRKPMTGTALVRMNLDGLVDLKFQHEPLLDSETVQWQAQAMAVSSVDGSIFITGYRYEKNVDVDMFVAKFDSSGRFKRDFGMNGVVQLDIGNKSRDEGTGIVSLPDGSMLVVGNVARAEGRWAYVAKLTKSGALDKSFGWSGIKNIDLGQNTGASSIAITTSVAPTYFLVGGNFGNGVISSELTGYFNYVAKFDLATGNLIAEPILFKGAPYAKNLRPYTVSSMAVQTNHKIIISGYSLDGSIYVAKLNPDGTLDTSLFGGAGKGYLLLDELTVTGLALQPGGYFYLGTYDAIRKFNTVEGTPADN